MADQFPGDGTHLQRYARVFGCAEINSSFYRPHSFELYARWASLTPRSFRFSVKLPKLITHEGRLRNARLPLERFLAEIAGLGEKLGVLLVQLPPSLEFDARVARNFFTLLRDRHEGAVVCEPRHPSWFTSIAEKYLVRFQIGRVAADPARMPEAKAPSGWMGADDDGAGATGYYRLHGSPRIYWSVYSSERIVQWAEELISLPRASDVWCIFDNTAGGGAISNALELMVRVGPKKGAPSKDAPL